MVDQTDSTHDSVMETFASSDEFDLMVRVGGIQFPPNWTAAQKRDFYKRYHKRIEPEVIAAATAPIVLEEEAEEGKTRLSRLSKEGFTLDTTVILNGASTTLRRLHEAGLLEPHVTYRSKRNSRGVPYSERVLVARYSRSPVQWIITPETYRALHPKYPQTDAKVEVMSDRQYEAIAKKVKPITADRTHTADRAVDGHNLRKAFRPDPRSRYGKRKVEE
jgi:hypothetical protein